MSFTKQTTEAEIETFVKLFDSSMTLTPSVISDGRLDYTILAGRSARPYHWPGDLPDLPESPCGCYTTLAVAGR